MCATARRIAAGVREGGVISTVCFRERYRPLFREARRLLAEYERPALDPAIDEALRDYIARREREIPAADALNNNY